MSALTRYVMVDRGLDDYQMMPMEGGEWVRGGDHDKTVAGLAAALRGLLHNYGSKAAQDAAHVALAKAGAL